MFPNILPLKAVAFQSLFLLMAIAIEARVLYQQLKLTPKQSIQFSTSINLLSTVLGWLFVFLVLNARSILPIDFRSDLLNFIFFNQLTNETASLLIVIGFVTFFASFTIEQLGLTGLQWLLHAQPPPPSPPSPPPKPSQPALTVYQLPPDDKEEPPIAPIRNLRKDASDVQPFRALLVANAWSYSAIALVLLLRIVITRLNQV
jgi:hypothetical protein